jgi:hypothetical protein
LAFKVLHDVIPENTECFITTYVRTQNTTHTVSKNRVLEVFDLRERNYGRLDKTV